MKYLDLDHFYIDGRFVPSNDRPRRVVIDLATEETAGAIAMGTAEDVDAAVVAARKAFGAYGYSPREERLEILRRVLKLFNERADEFVQLTTLEMGGLSSLWKPDQTSHFPFLSFGGR